MAHVALTGYIITDSGFLLGAVAYVDDDTIVVRSAGPQVNTAAYRAALMHTLAHKVASLALAQRAAGNPT